MNTLTDSSTTLTIAENSTCKIQDFEIEIESWIGHFADIHYFRVIIQNPEETAEKSGLLRIGSPEGGLQRELQLRQSLGEHKMISKLLAQATEESVIINFPSNPPVTENNILASAIKELELPQETENLSQIDETEEKTEERGETEANYLEEEFLPEKPIGGDSSGKKIIILSELPNEKDTLETWLKRKNTLEENLLIATQVCQFFKLASQQEWAIISIFPQFIKMGTPLEFFDLSSAYRLNEKLQAGLTGNYCPPEIAFGHAISEQMSTYVVASLLYQALQQNLPPRLDTFTEEVDNFDLKIPQNPRLYQLLTIALSTMPEERFSLSQFLSLLVETRQMLREPKVHWEIGSRSTVGLSISRLKNEDNYGIRQQQNSNSSESWILAAVADGMGGMAQGEVASKLAVETVQEALVPSDLNNPEKRNNWLKSLVEKANERVTNTVREGGTTLSLVFGYGRDLSLAHVGDSRIFLLRKGIICQLSEDHSMVALLLASAEITYEQSLNHPDRNVLIKSLGSRRGLSDGYIQNLGRFGGEISLSLEDGDILLLCSDGVWDLVPAGELAEIFTNQQNLQIAVNTTIDQVIEKGAHDNATVIALKCCIDSYCF